MILDIVLLSYILDIFNKTCFIFELKLFKKQVTKISSQTRITKIEVEVIVIVSQNILKL